LHHDVLVAKSAWRFHNIGLKIMLVASHRH
jgi:hypothetical protein